jgi:integrase
VGTPVDSANDQRQFKRLLKAAGARDFRVHDARHTAITNLVQEGIPLPTVQRIAGHSDIRTTISYVHLTDEAYDGAVAAVERLFA